MFPTVSTINTVNISSTADFDVVFGLSYVNTIVVCGRAKIFKGSVDFFVEFKLCSNIVISPSPPFVPLSDNRG